MKTAVDRFDLGNFLARGATFLATALVFWSLPLAGEAPASLSGTQKEKVLEIELKGDKVTLDGEYVIPAGMSLTIKGAGHIDGIKGKKCSFKVEGELIIGNPGDDPKDLSALPSIKSNKYVKCAVVNSKASFRVVHTTFEFYKTTLEAGGFTAKKALLKGAEFTIAKPDKVKVLCEQCAFTKVTWDTTASPAEAKKMAQFKNCVLFGANKFALALLWCMEKCDLYERPFSLAQPEWKSSPGPVQSVFFADAEFAPYMVESFKGQISGFKIKNAPKAFNPELKVNTGEGAGKEKEKKKP